MQGRIWTVPNQITLLRLGFLPLFLILIVYEHYRWALLILVLAGLSDGIDGLLARKLNQKSSIGAYLDPIADKLLLSSSFVILAMEKNHSVVADHHGAEPRYFVAGGGRGNYRDFRISAVSAELAGKSDDIFSDRVWYSERYWLRDIQARSLQKSIVCWNYLVAALTAISGFHYSFVTARRLSS